jgi:hypothetical protein
LIGKWQLKVVVEYSTTQNIIEKAKTVQSKKWGVDKEEYCQYANFFLSTLTDNEISAPPDLLTSNLQHFNSSVSSSNNGIGTQYS